MTTSQSRHTHGTRPFSPASTSRFRRLIWTLIGFTLLLLLTSSSLSASAQPQDALLGEGSIERSRVSYDRAGFHFNELQPFNISLLQPGPAPANDDFDNATVIDSLPFSDSLDTTGATEDPDDILPEDCAGAVLNSVWYRYTPATDGVILLETTQSDYSTVLAVFTGSRTDLQPVGCSAHAGLDVDRSILVQELLGGVTYHILAAGNIGTAGGNLELRVSDVEQPSNDDFDNPIAIDPSELPSLSFHVHRLATEAPDDPLPSCLEGRPHTNTHSVWFSYTAAEDGGLNLQILDSNQQTITSAWTGTRGALQEAGCDFIGAELAGSEPVNYLTIPVSAGTTYWIEVADPFQYGEPGYFYLQADTAGPPPNDDIVNAEVIDGLPFSGWVDMSLATTELTDPEPSCGTPIPPQQTHSVWYQYTPKQTQPIEVLSAFNDSLIVSLWSGVPGSLQEEGCIALSTFNVAVWLEGGTTYWLELAVPGDQRAGGTSFYVHEPPPPPNDDFDSATVISSLPFNDFPNMGGATVAADDPLPSCGAADPPTQSNTIWYEFTPSADMGLVSASRFSAFETVTALWTGTRGNLTEVACAVGETELNAYLFTGTTYFLELMQFGGPGGGSASLDLREGIVAGCYDGRCSFPVAQSSDDAGSVPQLGPTECVFSSTDDNIYFGQCNNGDPITSGFRFANVSIPSDGVIVDAYVQLMQDGPYSNGLDLSVFGEASASPDTFSPASTPEDRVPTSSSVPWAIPGDELWSVGEIDRTPNLAPVIREIMAQTGWSQGNSVAIIVQNAGAASGDSLHRRIIGYDRATRGFPYDPPHLVIQLGLPDADQSRLIVDPDTILADGADSGQVLVFVGAPDGTPLPGIEVKLQVLSGPPVDIDGSPVGSELTSIGVSDSEGLVSAEIRSTETGTRELAAFAADVPLSQTALVHFVTRFTDPTQSDLIISPTSLPADGQTPAQATVTLRDAAGLPVALHEVQFSATGVPVVISLPDPALTDAQGQIVGEIRSSEVGQVTIGATDLTSGITLDDEVILTFTLGTTDPDLSSVGASPAEVTADGSNAATVEVQLVDAGSRPLADHSVRLEVSGSDNSISGANPAQTDIEGRASFSFSSTLAEIKTITVIDETDGVTLSAHPQVDFIPGPVDPSTSLVRATALVPADGIAVAEVFVTVRDAHNNPIGGIPVSLILSVPTDADVITPPGNTDENGEARGEIVDATVETVTLRASAAGILLDESAEIRFRGADLTVSKSGLAESNYDGDSSEYALVGGEIIYTLTVTNEGLLPAASVELTDALDPDVNFLENLSTFDHILTPAGVVFQLDDLNVAQSAEVSFRAAISSSASATISNAAIVTTTGQEDDLLDNEASLTTVVEPPRPVMELSPSGPSMAVDQGEMVELTGTVRNSGAGDMTGIQLTTPASIPWVSTDASALTDLPPRTEAPFTLIASPPSDQTPGLYRDFVLGNDDYGSEERIALSVRVFAPRRDVRVTVRNDQGTLVSGAQVQLVRQTESVVVTEGIEQIYHETYGGNTDSSGELLLTAVQLGGYDFNLAAPDHELATGVVTVEAGEGVQPIALELDARGRIRLSPDSIVIGVVRGSSGSRGVQVMNQGAGPLTGLDIQTPAAIPWLSVAAPDPIPPLDPGASMTFSLVASPPEGVAEDIFQDFVTVSADGVESAELAVTVELANESIRDLQVNVVDEFDEPVGSGGEVVLVEQELTTLQLPGGETRTFNEQFTAEISGSGEADFAGLEPGSYNYFVSPEGYTQESGEILVQPGTGTQQATVASRFDPFTYSWTVEPLQVGYEVTLTMTYDVETAPPTLLVPEVCWQPESSPVVESLLLYNPSAIPLTLEDLSVSLPGANLSLGALPDQIPANSLLGIPVEVVKVGPLGGGAVFARYSWERAMEDFVTFTFNPSSKNSPLIPPGFFFETQYLIEPGVFNPDTSYQVTIQGPTELDWIQLSVDPTDEVAWPVDGGIMVSMYAEPPQFLDPGIYNDSALIRVDGADGTWREGTLEFEVTRTNEGATIHSAFVLGDVPSERQERSTSAELRADNCSRWTWSTVSGSPGTLTGSTSGSTPSFPSRGGGPTYQFDHQQVRVRLSQKIMLEGEGFKATLELNNTSSDVIQAVEIDVILRDANGLDRSAGFDLIPVTPTALGDIPVAGSTSQEWFILPSALGVTSPDGEAFTASAEITYIWGGDTFAVETVPEAITVYPAPDLVITYQLPLTDTVCTEFPLKVTIQNRGQGPARDLRFSTALPQVVDPISGSALAFTITETTLNGEPLGRELNVNVGDVPPDPEQPAVIVWRLETSAPGRFVEFTSDFRQTNYLDLPLKPLISEIRTFLVPGPCGEVPTEAVVCPSGECPGIALQGTQDYVGKPINTRTGSVALQATDFSFPTASGPLTFERWYASETVDVYTDLMGYGWTHSLDSRLYFPQDPQGQEGALMLKLHSANRFPFLITGENEFTAYPGLCGQLTYHDGPPVTYTFTDDALNLYTFDENGRIQTVADAEGRALHYSYDGQEQLSRVEDDSGQRWLEFGYDGEGRLTQVTDHGGRQASYAYDAAGDLISAVDLAGQTWTYDYSDHLLTEARDPRGVITERNEYDGQGRALRQFNGAGEQVVELTYNADGSVTSTDALGRSQTHVYDERGALAERFDAAGNSQEKSYDENFRPSTLSDAKGNTTELTWSETGGNLTELVDAQGNRIELTYDSLNNLTRVVDASNRSTELTYQGTLLVESEDALGNTTTYTYTDSGDAPAPPGLVESVTDPRGNTSRYSYNANGQRVSMTDALGNTTSFEYDDFGRLLATTDPLGRVTRNQYDALGRLTQTTRNYDPGRGQNEEGQYNIATRYEYDGSGNMVRVLDAFNRATSYTYDSANRRTSVSDPLNGETRMEYDDAGNLLRMTDSLNRTTRYEYDSLNRLVRSVDPLGNVTARSYDANGNLIALTVAAGNMTRFEYDSLNRQVAVIDALDNRSSTTYDAAGNVRSQTDAAGRTTTFDYDELDRLIRQTDARGGVTSHSYDAAGNRVATTDVNGNTTTLTYDVLNRLLSTTDALGGVVQYEYDGAGNRIAVVDANNQRTEHTYDGLNRLVETRTPLGQVYLNQYDALGNLIARVDPLGNPTTYDYDELNRLTEQTDSLGGLTSYTYDAVGNQLSFTDPRGHTTTTAYDALNRAVSSTDPNGDTTTTTYDVLGNVVAITDPTGATTGFTYDALRRQVSMTDPLGNPTLFEYDAVGNRTGVVDANGVVTRYEFDSLNRLTAVVENYLPAATSDAQANVRTEYTYDGLGNRISIVDANGHVTQFSYDALNRLIRESDPLGNTSEYGYDPAGNRTSMTDAESFTTAYVYDAVNRLVTIDYPDPDHAVSFTYDDAGNRTRMQDGAGTTTWSFDDLHRPVEVVDPFGDRVGYEYDAVGNRIRLSYPDGKTVDYGYDPENQLTQVTDWLGGGVDYAYDEAGRLIETRRPNGVITTYDYDAVGQLLELRHERGADLLSSFSYTYDFVGNRVRAVEVVNWPGQPQPVALRAAHLAAAGAKTEPGVLSDPLTLALLPFALLVLAPVMRRARPEVPGVLILLVLVAGAGLAVTACVPTPTPTPTPPPPTPTATPTPEPSGVEQAIDEARQLLDELIASGDVERLPGIRLDRRLRLADRFLQLGLESRARQQLDGFLRTVERYRGNGISEEAADQLVGEVEPIVDAMEREPLTPTVTCIEPADGGWIGHFGVVNENGSTAQIPVGALNRFQPPPEDRGQPTSFDPGTHEDLFTVPFEGDSLTWQLDGNEATASTASPLCELPPTPTDTPTPTPTPVPQVETTTTIDYVYDPLYRLTEANYDSGPFFHYKYDAVGNRLAETTRAGVTNYLYDAANRLVEVDGVPYEWDAKGNLLSDGVSTYSYDHANRLVEVVQGGETYSYAYNGLGDRLSQSMNGDTVKYTLDLTRGLTQVIADGETAYLYGVGRIGQASNAEIEYFLGDALASVRQVYTDSALQYAQSFQPFGQRMDAAGVNPTSYGFTGEWMDDSGLVHLRARYLNPRIGLFLSLDAEMGLLESPNTLHKWQYAFNSPLLIADPSGRCFDLDIDGRCDFPPYRSQPTSPSRYELSEGENYYGPYNLDGTRMSDEEFQRRRRQDDPYRSPGWSTSEESAIRLATWNVATSYAKAYNGIVRLFSKYLCESEDFLFNYLNRLSPNEAFLTLHGGAVEFVRKAETASQYFRGPSSAWGYTLSARKIFIFNNASETDVAEPRFIIHELAHAFENALVETIGNKAGREELREAELWTRNAPGELYGGFAGGLGDWQWSRQEGASNRGEIFADQFVGWVYDRWAEDPVTGTWTRLGQMRADYMNRRMPGWIFRAILNR